MRKICGENRILGTKDKIRRLSVGKADVNLMPRWGARVLFEPETKIKKTSSNPGLASLTLRKKLIDRLRKRGNSRCHSPQCNGRSRTSSIR